VTGCTAVDTTLDDRILPRALDIVTRLGRKVTFVVVASQSYSTATGKVTKVGVSNIVRVASPPLQYVDSWVDGDVIRRGDAQLIVPAEGLGFIPARKAEVLIDDGRWTIEDVQVIRSGNLKAAYVLQLRGAKAPKASTTSVQNALDRRLPATARRLIQKFGKRVIFEVASNRLRDVPEGTVLDEGVCQFCEQVVFDPTDRRVDPEWTSESEEGDVYLRADGLGFDPYKGMRVEFDGQRWAVASLEPIYTGGRIGAWRLGLGM
jgi:O-acetyl-ADP-ribose deacetylase (regulator of RNase III)